MAVHPEVLWAQRSSKYDAEKNIVYMTVNLPDIIESTLEYKLTPTNISVKAKAGNASKGIEEKEYEFSLDFYSEVVPEESTKKLSSRSLYLILRKKEHQQEFWPRLTKEKIRTAFVKTDFGKWVDEDEQDGEPVKAEEDMDPMGGGMGGMGGMPGMEGMDLEKMMAQMGGGMGGLGGGMGGMGGMGGDFGAGSSRSAEEGEEEEEDDDDDDDDGPPPLEDAEATTAPKA